MTVRRAKKQRLEAKGWKFGSTRDFLKLTAAEAAYIEMKLRLGRSLRERRELRGLTQVDLAKRLKSSQSRVAKMEAGHPSVSLDLMVKAFLTLKTSLPELSRVIASRAPVSAA
jgi:ribosome-binding protein aMBF1 (putative translation factor)